MLDKIGAGWLTRALGAFLTNNAWFISALGPRPRASARRRSKTTP
jgi:hypothetical protein